MKIKLVGRLLLMPLLGLVLQMGPVAVVQAQDPAAQVLQLVNQLRSSYGLAGFTYNGQLAAAAQQQANWMASTGQYVHNHGGSTPQTRAQASGYAGAVSENIVGGTALTPRQGVTWWQNSAVHFNTMISTRYTEAGIGVASGLEQNFFVLVVGNPSARPPASGAPVAQAPPAFVAPIVLATPAADGSIVHTVMSGHTLWAVAARYEVPLETLLLYNNLKESDVLRPGDTLLIQLAEGQTPPPTPTPPATHLVRAGETAWTIAARYRLSLQDILWLNGLTEDSILRPGDEVIIRLLPGQEPPPTPTPQLTHLIQQGDTLWGIALTYGLSLDELLALNGLTADSLIREGEALFIRSPATATPVPTPTSQPTATSTATPPPARLTEPATRTPTTVAPSSTPTLAAAPAAGGMGIAMLVGSIVAGLGLAVLALVAVVVIRREA